MVPFIIVLEFSAQFSLIIYSCLATHRTHSRSHLMEQIKPDISAFKILLLSENPEIQGDFEKSFVSGLHSNGSEIHLEQIGLPWTPDFDVVIGYGPFSIQGSILRVGKQLLELPAQRRPVFVWWLTEGIPDPRLPKWLVRSLAQARLEADQFLIKRSASIKHFWLQQLMKGHRVRILGELSWMQAHGLLDVLAVTSTFRANYLRNYGFQPVVVPLGYHPTYGTDLGLEKTVDVIFLGQYQNSLRRRRLLPPIFSELERRGVKCMLSDGSFGEERNKLLNRSKIMINILRSPQDFTGQRFLLGAANKTMIISEPIQDLEPYISGKHLVLAPHSQFTPTILEYLKTSEKRQRIVENAYQFVTQELTIEHTMSRILKEVRQQLVLKRKGS